MPTARERQEKGTSKKISKSVYDNNILLIKGTPTVSLAQSKACCYNWLEQVFAYFNLHLLYTFGSEGSLLWAIKLSM